MAFWDPFSELEELRERLDRLYGTRHEHPAHRRLEGRRSGGEVAPALSGWHPHFDVRETDDSFVLHADLPGVAQKDINVEVQGKTVSVSGSRQVEKKSDTDRWHRSERQFGSFRRVITLPASANVDAAAAHYDNGVLELRIPKEDTTRARKIELGGAVAMKAPELLPIAAKLQGTYHKLRALQKKSAFTAQEVTALQDEIRAVEAQRRPDGTFGGDPKYEGTSAREAVASALLHRCHRLASSLLRSTEVHPAYQHILGELEEIEAGLEELKHHPRADARRWQYQWRLDRIDQMRKNNAFPGPDGKPLPGQAYLHELLQHCYDLIDQLQSPTVGEVDSSLNGIKQQLEESISKLEALRKRGGATPAELQAIRDVLLAIDAKRSSTGVFFAGAEAKITYASEAPKGQAFLSSLLHRAHRLLRFLEESTEVAPESVHVALQLEEIKGRLKALKAAKHIDTQELQSLREILARIDTQRSGAAFKDEKGGVPGGQAYLHNLLAACWDLVGQVSRRAHQ